MDSVQTPKNQTIEVRSGLNQSPLAGGKGHLSMTNQGQVGVSAEAMAWWDDIIMKRPMIKRGLKGTKGSTHRVAAQHVGGSTHETLAAESTRRGSIDDSLMGGPSTSSNQNQSQFKREERIKLPQF